MIPEFQREYVWKPSKAPKLLDSLYHGFPVSSLLVWESDGEVKTRRREPRRASGARTRWLIDGQQRVITLARSLAGDEGIDVVFNVKEEEFRRANAATRRDPDWIRVREIWDEEGFRRLRRNLNDDKLEERIERVHKILDYEIPAVHMIDHSFDDAVRAFTRINTLGVKLKKQDIESANVAAKHSGFIRDEVAPKIADLARVGFDRLDVTHLFRACAFLAHPDGRRRTPLHELNRREVTQAWKKTLRGLDAALGLVRSELGLVNMRILWSGALLVPPILLCASLGPRERNGKEIAGWIALAALLHRYSGSSATALEQDLRACRDPDPIRVLLRNLRSKRQVLEADERDFQGGLADKSGLLAVYIACRQRGALDIFTGQKILLQSNIDRHHILPRAQFEPRDRPSADTLANIAFLDGGTNKAIGAASPDVYLKQIKGRVLDSQCVPKERRLWAIARADDFWAARREQLVGAFNEFLRDCFPDRKNIA
ncbi:MAG: DUF262 domain-containing protein [Deltaproteobacteria bacterium]|nr:DUF262 domain-containing protein [Deltaproteobacteria bacterium]